MVHAFSFNPCNQLRSRSLQGINVSNGQAPASGRQVSALRGRRFRRWLGGRIRNAFDVQPLDDRDALASRRRWVM
jgi:hypothetical protein